MKSNTLVRRLRDGARVSRAHSRRFADDIGDMFLSLSDILSESATEIERLRLALKHVGDDYPGSSCQRWCYLQAGLRKPK